MIKTKFIPPYTETKCNLLFAKGKSGVYIIKKSGKIVYVGYSETDIYKTCTRHFQSWNDKTQTRVTYRDKTACTVRIILTTPARAAKLEKGLIIAYEPTDNPDKLKNYTITTQAAKIMDEYEHAPQVGNEYWDGVNLPF
jgi:excinuclease UvrABC nuclease subunit